jgi:peroxiredoxin
MNAWFRDQNITKIKPIGDGEGKFTKEMNMLVNKPKQGFGMRSWRYSTFIDNCEIVKLFVENGKNDESNDSDPFKVSDVNTMLNYLKG